MADGDANDLRLICSLCKIYVKNVEEYGWHLRDVHTSLTDRNKKESEPKFTCSKCGLTKAKRRISEFCKPMNQTSDRGFKHSCFKDYTLDNKQIFKVTLISLGVKLMRTFFAQYANAEIDGPLVTEIFPVCADADENCDVQILQYVCPDVKAGRPPVFSSNRISDLQGFTLLDFETLVANRIESPKESTSGRQAMSPKSRAMQPCYEVFSDSDNQVTKPKDASKKKHKHSKTIKPSTNGHSGAKSSVTPCTVNLERNGAKVSEASTSRPIGDISSIPTPTLDENTPTLGMASTLIRKKSQDTLNREYMQGQKNWEVETGFGSEVMDRSTPRQPKKRYVESDEDSKEAPVASDANDRNYVPPKDDLTGESDDEEDTRKRKKAKKSKFQISKKLFQKQNRVEPYNPENPVFDKKKTKRRICGLANDDPRMLGQLPESLRHLVVATRASGQPSKQSSPIPVDKRRTPSDGSSDSSSDSDGSVKELLHEINNPVPVENTSVSMDVTASSSAPVFGAPAVSSAPMIPGATVMTMASSSTLNTPIYGPTLFTQPRPGPGPFNTALDCRIEDVCNQGLSFGPVANSDAFGTAPASNSLDNAVQQTVNYLNTMNSMPPQNPMNLNQAPFPMNPVHHNPQATATVNCNTAPVSIPYNPAPHHGPIQLSQFENQMMDSICAVNGRSPCASIKRVAVVHHVSSSLQPFAWKDPKGSEFYRIPARVIYSGDIVFVDVPSIVSDIRQIFKDLPYLMPYFPKALPFVSQDFNAKSMCSVTAPVVTYRYRTASDWRRYRVNRTHSRDSSDAQGMDYE